MASDPRMKWAADPLDPIMDIDTALGRLLEIADRLRANDDYLGESDTRKIGLEIYTEVSVGLDAVAKLIGLAGVDCPPLLTDPRRKKLNLGRAQQHENHLEDCP